MAALIAMMNLVPMVSAAETADITVTVMVQYLSVTVSPNWAIGTVIAGATDKTWTPSTAAQGGYFTATNDGNVNEKFTIKAANSVGWTVGATASTNIFAMGFGQTATLGTEPTYTYLTISAVDLVSSVAPNDTYKFDLQFKAPTSDSTHSQQSIATTITAVAA